MRGTMVATSSGREAKRSTSFKLEYIPRASALGGTGRTWNISLCSIYPVRIRNRIASNCYLASIPGERSIPWREENPRSLRAEPTIPSPHPKSSTLVVVMMAIMMMKIYSRVIPPHTLMTTIMVTMVVKFWFEFLATFNCCWSCRILGPIIFPTLVRFVGLLALTLELAPPHNIPFCI